MTDNKSHYGTATGQVLSIHVTVNGHVHDVLIEPYLTLIELIRDRLGLTGTKKSCDMQVCGVCTVLLNGRPVSACTMLAFEARNASLLTTTFVFRPAERVLTTPERARAARVKTHPPRVGVVEVSVPAAWVEVTADPWQIAYRLALQDRAVVISEIRIFPAGSARKRTNKPRPPSPKKTKRPPPKVAPPGEWFEALRGVHARVPLGGVTSAIVRAAMPGAHVARTLPKILRHLERVAPPLVRRARGPRVCAPARSTGPPTGRRPPPDASS